MPEQPGAGRLEPEVLAAYIDGLLPPEERARVDAEIAADPETYEWVVNSINAVDDPTIVQGAERSSADAPRPRPSPAPMPSGEDASGDGRVVSFYRRMTTRGTVGALLATAAAVLIVVTLQRSEREVDGERRMEAIVKAVGAERYVGVRLTGSFPPTTGRTVVRGAPRASAQNLQLRAAAAEARRAAVETPSPALLHAAGVGTLLEGADPSGAIDSLERAVRARDSVVVRSDLFAAIVEAYQRTPDAALFRRAAELAEALLRGNPPQEFLYNWAYFLELRGDYSKAVSAWQDYLSSVHGSGWEAEARSRLEAAKVLAEGRP